MPRTARASVGDVVYHAINRGNANTTVFASADDFAAFESLMARAHERRPMRVLAYCLMPDHFHVVLWPRADGDLSAWMQWLMTAHVRQHHRRYASTGHIWQGRFRAFPVQGDDHLLTVMRYVERNPVRAGLVEAAADWTWSSLKGAPWVVPGPVAKPPSWSDWLIKPETETELSALRRSVNRGTPWGEPDWVQQTALRLGIESTLRPRGRPRKLPA